MVQLFRLAAFMAKHKLSFHMYEELVTLLSIGGINVGDIDHSRVTARERNETIAEFGRKQLTNFIKEKSCVTSRLHHVGVAADKLTDLGGKQSQMSHVKGQQQRYTCNLFCLSGYACRWLV